MPRRPVPNTNLPAVTAMESPDDIRRALEARKHARQAAAAPPAPAPQPPAVAGPLGLAAATAPSAELPSMPRAAAPYRPTFRPPVALLTVCDDGKKDGEVFRLRTDRFVIGRTEGDLLLPHDGLVSGRHVEITRQRTGDGWRWLVSDLRTTNGLFVRVSRADLVDGAEFLVGRGRYRFEAPAALGAAIAAGPIGPGSDVTRPWGAEAPGLCTPVLAELLAGMEAARFPLVAEAYWIGSDPACAVCRANDPFAEPRHVRLARAGKGDWEARNNNAANGLWLRVAEICVNGVCLFQAGEQRFSLTVGG